MKKQTQDLTQSARPIQPDEQKDNQNNNNNNNKNNNNNIRKRKITSTLWDYGIVKIGGNNNNHNDNKRRKLCSSSSSTTYLDNIRLPRQQLHDIIKKFSNKLGYSTLFPLLPTIDCFASKRNYQTLCKKYITQKDNFFSSSYDSTDFWKNEVAWCFPPYNRKTIVDCVNLFKTRKMKGYVCMIHRRWQGHEYIGQTQSICLEYICMKGRDKKDDIFVADQYQVYNKIAFDTIIFYFDYQK